jgi:hypothetical protein
MGSSSLQLVSPVEYPFNPINVRNPKNTAVLKEKGLFIPRKTSTLYAITVA